MKCYMKLIAKKYFFETKKIQSKLSNTNFKNWDLWVNKFNNFYVLFSKFRFFEDEKEKNSNL